MSGLADLDLSTIETLTLWLYDHEDEGGEVILEDLEPLYEMDLPALRALGLYGCEFGRELIEVLPDAVLFAGLESLALVRASNTGSFLEQDSAETLLSEPYAHLTHIDVTGSFCDPRVGGELFDRA